MSEMATYQAVAIAEGFEDASLEAQIDAWSYLIRTGLAWQLQGWFGRTARSMIENGLFDAQGSVNWDRYYELVDSQ